MSSSDLRGTPAHGELYRPQALVPVVILLLSALAAATIAFGRYPGLDEHAYPVFMQQILYDDRVQAIAMLLALLAAMLLLVSRAWHRAVCTLADAIGAYPLRTCAVVLVVLVAAAKWVYQGFPYSMDEYAPLLQARAFAEGSLTVTYPAALLDLIVFPAYQGYFILVNPETGQAMSAYWPGLAILMAPFAVLGLESVLNPALSALALWLIGDLAVKVGGDDRYRGWAMLAAIASPQFTINAISFYAMPGLLSLNLLFFWLLLRVNAKASVLAGLVGGLALVMVNPVPHALFAFPCLVWMLVDGRRRRQVLWVGLGYLPVAIVLGLGWPWLGAELGMVRTGGSGAALGPSAGLLQDWLLRLKGRLTEPGLDRLLARWYASWKAWIWMAPGLAVLPWLGRWRGHVFWVMASAVAVTYVFYFFVPYDQGYGWGYRYIHPAWGFFPVFAGIAIAHPRSGLQRLGGVLLVAGTLATPVFAWIAHQRIDAALDRRIEAPLEGSSVVFINLPKTPPNIELVQNYPRMKNTMYLISQGDEKDKQLMTALWPQAQRAHGDDRGSLWMVPPSAVSADR